MSAEDAQEAAVRISAELLDLSGRSRDLDILESSHRQQIDEFTRRVTVEIRRLYFLDISRPQEGFSLKGADDAFEAAERISKQILALSGRGYDIEILELQERQLMEVFSENITDLIMWLDWLYIRRPQKLYDCAMPYNSWAEPRNLMRRCVSCKKYFCKKHNLTKCVDCGNPL